MQPYKPNLGFTPSVIISLPLPSWKTNHQMLDLNSKYSVLNGSSAVIIVVSSSEQQLFSNDYLTNLAFLHQACQENNTPQQLLKPTQSFPCLVPIKVAFSLILTALGTIECGPLSNPPAVSVEPCNASERRQLKLTP